jgi:hypothetical protein
MPNEERSEGGSRIYRHEARTHSARVAPTDAESVGKIEEHIDRFVGGGASVFHELVSAVVHIDIHMVPPSERHPFRTLVTTGMSDLPMSPPKAYADLRYAELVMCLPPDWPVEQKDFRKEEHYWPFRLMKVLARLPHEYHTWLWATHTVPHGNPPRRYARNTHMICALLAAPVLFEDGFHQLDVHEGKRVTFFGVLPIHREEMDFKLKKGADALFDLLAAQRVTELLDPARKSVVQTKKRFGLL